MSFLKIVYAIIICAAFTLPQNLFAQHEDCWELYMKANTASMQFNDSLAVVYYRKHFSCNTTNSDALFGMSSSMASLSQLDSSIIYLEKAIDAGWSKFSWLTNNLNFDKLHLAFPERWDVIMAKYKEQRIRDINEKGYNAEVYLLLDSLNTQDQRLLGRMGAAHRTKESMDSLIMEKNIFEKSVISHLNDIIRILGGVPTLKNVGVKGEENAFLLVQHLDGNTDYQKAYYEKIKYLPTDEIPAKHFAYLTDRVLINSGQNQLFGTQVDSDKGKFFPIGDPKNFSKRLAEHKLGTIEEWLKYYSEVLGVPMPDYVE